MQYAAARCRVQVAFGQRLATRCVRRRIVVTAARTLREYTEA